MIVKLLIEHHLEFLSLTGGCRGSSESTHVKMPHCWKSHATAHIISFIYISVAYTQIDWHDFVVVETVDFQPNEQGL